MEVSSQWADTLLGLERLLLLKVAVWGALTTVAGTLLVALHRAAALTATTAPVFRSLGIALGGLGIAELVFAVLARVTTDLRDLESATSLDRGLWLAAGLALGWSTAALGLAFSALRARPRRNPMAGASLGVALHGFALSFLALQLAMAVVR